MTVKEALSVMEEEFDAIPDELKLEADELAHLLKEAEEHLKTGVMVLGELGVRMFAHSPGAGVAITQLALGITNLWVNFNKTAEKNLVNMATKKVAKQDQELGLG